jgi:hypothetical protein
LKDDTDHFAREEISGQGRNGGFLSGEMWYIAIFWAAFCIVVDVRELEMEHPLALEDYRRYGRQMILDGFGLPGEILHCLQA